jgi:hypothetical protein
VGRAAWRRVSTRRRPALRHGLRVCAPFAHARPSRLPALRCRFSPWREPWLCRAPAPGGPGLRLAPAVLRTVCVGAQPSAVCDAVRQARKPVDSLSWLRAKRSPARS